MVNRKIFSKIEQTYQKLPIDPPGSQLSGKRASMDHKPASYQIKCCGYTWLFSAPALAQLQQAGLESGENLRHMIRQIQAAGQVTQGTHDYHYAGSLYQVVVRDQRVSIDCHPSNCIEAFGQTWLFSAAALQVLHANPAVTPTPIKWFLVNFATAEGYPDGSHRAECCGVELQLIVKGEVILVDDPYRSLA
jgi:hypothetical protein